MCRKAQIRRSTGKNGECAAVRWLAGGEGEFRYAVYAVWPRLKSAMEKESNVVIVFGAGIDRAPQFATW